MTILSLIRNNLAYKAEKINQAEDRLKKPLSDAGPWIEEYLSEKEFVLFCGAGVSIPPPASAPAFLDLRDSLLLAITDLLLERGLINSVHSQAVEGALKDLEQRADLEMPPEMVFDRVRHALDMDVVHQLLSCCLDFGKPNENHLAIRELINRKIGAPRLTGVITPNFDLYIERALQGIRVQRTVVNENPEGSGFPLYKPHGSLDRLNSIAITIDRVIRPLKGTARDSFKKLTEDGIVVVIGYSGWDYDLFPLLVNAGRKWNTNIVWVIYDENAMNERVAKLQLSIEDRCKVLNSRMQAILPSLADIKISCKEQYRPYLRQEFTNVLKKRADVELSSALIGLVTPIGVPDTAGVVAHLCVKLLRLVEEKTIKDDGKRIKILGPVVSLAEDDPHTRIRAAQLALDAAERLGNEKAARVYRRIIEGKEESSDSPAARLRRVERDLDEFPFSFDHDPEPTLAESTLRRNLLIEKASLLMDLRRTEEAEALARSILNGTRFPESGISENAHIVADGYARFELHSILGGIAARKKNISEVEAQYCAAIDVLWQELEFWRLTTVLQQMAYEISHLDYETGGHAMDLSVRISRYIGDLYSELYNLEWKHDYGSGTFSDLERAENLLKTLNFAPEDHQRHKDVLNRMRKKFKSY